MKYLTLLILFVLSVDLVFPQSAGVLQNKSDINQKLKTLSRTSPDAAAGLTFDNSFEGLKGGPYLFDQFIPLLVKVKEADYFLQVTGNIDLVKNSFLYIDDESKKVFSVPGSRVVEIVQELNDSMIIYRTTKSKVLKPEENEIKFIQVILEEPVGIIKMPLKTLVLADYRGGYTANRRYDEYKNEIRYYIMSPDCIYKKVSLTKRSLIRYFPAKKEIIKKEFKEKRSLDDETRFLSVIEKF